MPRGATSQRARATRNRNASAGAAVTESATPDTVSTTDKEVPNVSTATATAPTTETEETTVRELPFEVNISAAPEDYRPDRSPAGRKRIPSPFEAVLPALKGKGWQNQPHDGNVKVEEGGKVELPDGAKESNARVILRELSKAVKFLNSDEGGELNLGLDVNVTATDVQFNIRDKQNRKPRTPQGEEAADGESNDDDTDSDTDNGDE